MFKQGNGILPQVTLLEMIDLSRLNLVLIAIMVLRLYQLHPDPSFRVELNGILHELNGMEWIHHLGLQPNIERYMRDNNRQTIEKLGFAGFGKNE